MTDQNQAALIGTKMPMDEFNRARAATEGGRIWQPKEGGEYMGKVVMWNDTHVVQKIGNKVGIVHDRAALDKDSQAMLTKAIGDGSMSSVSLKVGYENGQGKAQVFTYKQEQVEKTSQSLLRQVEKFTDKPAQRELLEKFVKHWSDTLNKAMPAPAPEKQAQAQKQDAPAAPKR